MKKFLPLAVMLAIIAGAASLLIFPMSCQIETPIIIQEIIEHDEWQERGSPGRKPSWLKPAK